jgi:DNA-binding transcriptional LysR family regulator
MGKNVRLFNSMNLRQLRTLVAIAEQGSFTAAGNAVGLSHSAISLHVKALEEELGIALADRTQRPPRLTARGIALVEQARRMAALEDEIRALGSDEALAGSLAVGVVPTAMVHLLPPALARLRALHPKLAIRVRTGLSSELAQAVRGAELDVAVVTRPDIPPEGLGLHEIAREPLVVIAPANATEATDADLIAPLTRSSGSAARPGPVSISSACCTRAACAPARRSRSTAWKQSNPWSPTASGSRWCPNDPAPRCLIRFAMSPSAAHKQLATWP